MTHGLDHSEVLEAIRQFAQRALKDKVTDVEVSAHRGNEFSASVVTVKESDDGTE